MKRQIRDVQLTKQEHSIIIYNETGLTQIQKQLPFHRLILLILLIQINLLRVVGGGEHRGLCSWKFAMAEWCMGRVKHTSYKSRRKTRSSLICCCKRSNWRTIYTISLFFNQNTYCSHPSDWCRCPARSCTRCTRESIWSGRWIPKCPPKYLWISQIHPIHTLGL